MKGITSCKGCEDRYLGCHSSCERYIEDRKRYDEEIKAYKDSKAKELDIRGYELTQRMKLKRRKLHEI